MHIEGRAGQGRAGDMLSACSSVIRHPITGMGLGSKPALCHQANSHQVLLYKPSDMMAARPDHASRPNTGYRAHSCLDLVDPSLTLASHRHSRDRRQQGHEQGRP